MGRMRDRQLGRSGGDGTKRPDLPGVKTEPARPSAPAPPPSVVSVPAKPAPVQQPSPALQQEKQANAAPPRQKTIYEADYEERKAFESQEHVILDGTVQRLGLGQILTSRSAGTAQVLTPEAAPCTDDGHMEGYVWGLGKRPKHMAGPLKLVGAKEKEEKPWDSVVYERLVEIARELKRHSMPLEEGPYADKGGNVDIFTKLLFKDVKERDISGLIERVIDMRPFITPQSELQFPRQYTSFVCAYNNEYMTGDNLPTVGEILSQTRIFANSVTMEKQFQIVHPMEPYLLAVAALRRKGLSAYPAYAVLPGQDGSEEGNPLIVILDLSKEVPLTTFDMLRFHPPAGALDIFSDVAVEGALHAMRATMRVKHLTVEMVQNWKTFGKTFSNDELMNQFERIARSLFEATKRWDGCPFIPRTTTYLYLDALEAIRAMDYRNDMPDTSSPPVLVGPGELRYMTFAESTAHMYVEKVLLALARMIAKARKEEKKEEKKE